MFRLIQNHKAFFKRRNIQFTGKRKFIGFTRIILIFAILLINCNTNIQTSLPSNGPIPGLIQNSHYFIYYGDWHDTEIRYAENFQLVILHPHSNITPAIVLDIRDGKDNISGTEDDVKVTAYISLGEEHPGPIAAGDGRGPMTWEDGELIFQEKGVAGYYIDQNNDGQPDVNGTWKSYFINAGDENWQTLLKNRHNGLDYIADTLKCDGFFMDTIDSAAPQGNFGWMDRGMARFIKKIREWYPQSIMIANRGIFYFYKDKRAYKWNIRPYINAVMFEAYFTAWDWENKRGSINPWFAIDHKPVANEHLNREAAKPDGFNVLCLDYLSLEQPDYQEMLKQQKNEVAQQPGWLNCITDVHLKQCRNDIYDSSYARVH